MDYQNIKGSFVINNLLLSQNLTSGYNGDKTLKLTKVRAQAAASFDNTSYEGNQNSEFKVKIIVRENYDSQLFRHFVNIYDDYGTPYNYDVNQKKYTTQSFSFDFDYSNDAIIVPFKLGDTTIGYHILMSNQASTRAGKLDFGTAFGNGKRKHLYYNDKTYVLNSTNNADIIAFDTILANARASGLPYKLTIFNYEGSVSVWTSDSPQASVISATLSTSLGSGVARNWFESSGIPQVRGSFLFSKLITGNVDPRRASMVVSISLNEATEGTIAFNEKPYVFLTRDDFCGVQGQSCITLEDYKPSTGEGIITDIVNDAIEKKGYIRC